MWALIDTKDEEGYYHLFKTIKDIVSINNSINQSSEWENLKIRTMSGQNLQNLAIRKIRTFSEPWLQ